MLFCKIGFSNGTTFPPPAQRKASFLKKIMNSHSYPLKTPLLSFLIQYLDRDNFPLLKSFKKENDILQNTFILTELRWQSCIRGQKFMFLKN